MNRLPELKEIKIRRKQLGLTQAGLAELCGISQSLIAKIESNQLIPSYENAKRIFDALNSLHKRSEIKAIELIQGKLYSVSPNDSVRKAVSLMEKKAVSQLPVLDEGKAVGRLSEKIIISRLTGSSKDLKEIKVSEIMDDAMPIIQGNTPQNLIFNLLEFNEAVLVSKQGKIKGIITKSDLLSQILKRK